MAHVTDDFSSGLSNFSNGPGIWQDMQVTGGTARASPTGSYCAARWNGTAIGANQYAQILIASLTMGSSHEGGPVVRIASASDGDSYLIDLDDSGGNSAFYRLDDTGGPNFVILGATIAYNPTVGDSVKLTVNGTTLEMFVNGVSQGTRADSTYSNGQPGIFAQCGVNTAHFQIDDFAAGDGTGPPGPGGAPPPARVVSAAVTRAAFY